MAQINKPTDYFETKTWTGNATERQITLDFQPDWVWIKNRSQTFQHILTDSVRGATIALFSSVNNAESANAQDLKSFDSDGFTIGTDGNVNSNSQPIVGWSWLAGGTAVSNTDGSITSNVSANTTSGFSIVSYTGTGANATVGHGLSSAPAMIIVKRRSSTGEWIVYCSVLGSGNGLKLNTTGASFAADATVWNSTNPTSSVFSIGTAVDLNASGNTYIAYCFAEKQGFSKFGKFSGTTGEEFVYTGFKPAFVILKRTNTTSDWYMFDNKRNPFNLSNKALDANTSDAEATYGSGLDLLSNGFVDKTFLADNGNELIYMAFAEEPLVGDNPATAR